MDRVSGAGQLEVQRALFPGGLINSIIPGSTTVHSVQVTAHVQCTFLLKREGRTGCRATPACPQARRGMAAGNFLWEAWYRTTLISSTPLKLTGSERMQVK